MKYWNYVPHKFLPTHLKSISVYPPGQVHVAPTIGARLSVQDCPGRHDISAQPSASFSQISPSYATIIM